MAASHASIPQMHQTVSARCLWCSCWRSIEREMRLYLSYAHYLHMFIIYLLAHMESFAKGFDMFTHLAYRIPDMLAVKSCQRT